jgi:hypothetical protein
MRKFILQTILFIAVAIIAITILLFSTNRIINQKATFNIPANIDKIVIGHSHPECAFNDSLIENFANFSKSGESYFYTYYKIAGLLQQNKTIKTVFIEFTNDQVNENKNEWIWGGKYISYQYPVYAPFMDREANQLLGTKNPGSFLNNQSVLLKNNFNIIKDRSYDYAKKIGGYEYSVRDKTDSILALAEMSNEPGTTGFKVSEKNMYCLEKIIEECKKQKKQVYFIRSPIHAKSPVLNNEVFFQQVLHSRFAGIEFLDFKNFPLSNAEFGNLEHLNFRGARKISIFFNKLFQDGLLEKKNKQGFINESMKMMAGEKEK